ncbi:MAG: hypothetical protein Fur007_04470 [Rhodoferax sp.]
MNAASPHADPDTAPAHTLRLILGDQLDPQHPWFAQVDPGVVYTLMEVRQETDYARHHAQKVLALFAAMRAFADALRAQGHRVVYWRIGDAGNAQTLRANLRTLLLRLKAQRFEYQAPDEWRLDQEFEAFSAAKADGACVSCCCIDSSHFLTTRTEAATFFGPRRQWLMEDLYRHLRRRHGVLLDVAGQPEGGRWNFDAENRKAWRGPPQHPAEPPDPRPCHDRRALLREIEATGVRTVGDAQAQTLRWPVDRAESLALLHAFVAQALPYFGDYQDALSTRATHLFHSLLSFSLNTKMLRPLEVIQAAEAAYRVGHAPLAAVEGFIRQILG